MKVLVKKSINSSAWKSLEDKIKRKMSVQVGWFPQAKYFDKGETSIYHEKKHTETAYVAQVAIINEFGGKAIEGSYVPPRPFMRPAAKDNKGAWATQFSKDIKTLPTKYALDRLGFTVEGDIKKDITNVWEPPLKPLTVYNRLKKQGAFQKKTKEDTHNAIMKHLVQVVGTRSGIAKPLIDTGYMIASVTHEVSND